MQTLEEATPDHPSSDDEEAIAPRTLNRYKNSVATFIPLRTPVKDVRTDLPIDDVGCVTNTSFNWVRKYLISAKAWNTYKNSLSPFLESLVTDHKLLIPNPPKSDSCEVNGRRYLRIFKEQEANRDPEVVPRFMPLVAWKFCSTRVLVSTLIYALSIFIGFLGTILFLQLTLRSMQKEFDLVETIYLRAVQSSVAKHENTAESPYHSPLKLSEFLWGKAGKNSSKSVAFDSFLPVDLFKHATEFNGDQESSNDSALFSMMNTQLMTASLFVFLNLTKNKEDALSEFMRFEDDIKIEQLNRIGFSVGLVLCVVTAFYLRSTTNWMNLRTATRLRSGILASVYRRAMKSSVNYTVSANQILTVANEESNVIFNVVENGALVVGTLFGVVCSLVAAFVLLNVTGFWPTVVMVVELALLVLLAKVASYYFRQGMTSSGTKLSVVEEVCTNFKSIIVLGLEKIYLDRFFEASVNHHTMIRKAVVWSSASFIGGITSAVLLTGLYVNWCFVETDGISVLILIIVFAYFLKSLVLEFGQSVQSIAMGMSALNNLLKYYMMVKPKAFKSFPPAPYVAKITEEAAFKWPGNKSIFQLNVDSFSLIKGQVVGLTGPSGSGKTTFLYSLLGHTQIIRGLVRLNVKMAFFPKVPVIIAGSLKDNILMGAEYDPRRYYDAICAVKLNKDVFVTTDTDEMPIGGLELNREQLERVALARAAYSDGEVFLFDDPLSSVKNTKEAVFYLKSVLEMMAKTKKTVLMATQNGELLAKCRIIHLLDAGKIVKSATYTEFVELRTFPKVYEDYAVLRDCAGYDEVMNGCHPNAVNTIKPQKIKLSRRSIRLNTAAHNINAEEIMMEQENKIKATLKNLPMISYTFLFFVHIVSNLMYYLLPFGFIVIVKRRYIDTWLTYVGVSVVISIFLLDLLTRYHLAYVSQILSKRYERYLFFRLFRTSVNYLKTKVVSDVVNWFNMDMFATFQPYAAIIQSSVAAALAVALLIISNPWTIMLVPPLIVGFVIIYLRLQYTVSHLYEKEYLARQKLFMVVTNHLSGRSVIQSFNRVGEFSDIAYKLIEENTTSIFLRKSMKYHGQFLLNVLLAIGLSGLCLIMLLIPYSKLSVHRYALSIFAYFSLGYYLHRLLFDGMLEIIVSKIKLENTKNNQKQIEMVKSPTAIETIADISKGVSVSFKDIVCKVAMKNVLEIRKVHCRNAEMLGVRGKGATCIVPMMYRIMNPESGAVFLAEHDLQQFDDTQLKTLVGVVLSDPYVPKVSVQKYLDPRSQWKTADIIEALRQACLFEKVKPFIFEPIEELTQSEKQLLCLAKCLMTHPKILFIENLHPHTQYIMDICVKKYFKDAAVIIIGGSEKQFTMCDRMSELV